MSDFRFTERLQPSLLDRLIDHNPKSKTESREQRMLSVSQLRDCVLRDLTWLLNTEHMASTEDLSNFPFAEASVLNYGRPAMSGRTSSGIQIGDLEDEIRKSILRYEPRLIPQTLEVAVTRGDEFSHQSALMIEISGQLWADPLPISMFMRTEVDLEGGGVKVIESS